MKSLLRMVFIFVLLLSFGLIALAQNGGKAEGEEIKFKRGASNATVSNSIKNDLEYTYTFNAKAGQLATLKVTSAPLSSVTFEIRFNGEIVTGEMNDAGTEWSGMLPEDGEYWVFVKRKSVSKGTSKFSLRLSIK